MRSKLNHRKGLDMALDYSGLSVTQMCNKLGISRVTWDSYRNGHVGINMERAIQISEMAGADARYMLDWMDYPKRKELQNEPERPNT